MKPKVSSSSIWSIHELRAMWIFVCLWAGQESTNLTFPFQSWLSEMFHFSLVLLVSWHQNMGTEGRWHPDIFVTKSLSPSFRLFNPMQSWVSGLGVFMIQDSLFIVHHSGTSYLFMLLRVSPFLFLLGAYRRCWQSQTLWSVFAF